MDFSSFYRLCSADKTNALQVEATPETSAYIGRETFAITMGINVPDRVLTFRRVVGKQPMDIISSSFVSIYLISGKVVDVLRDNRVTGWTTYPVLIKSNRDKFIDGYHGLVACGRSGSIIDSMSKHIIETIPPQGNRKTLLQREAWLGLYFDINIWDGCDFFMPADIGEETGHIFVTEKVVNIFRNKRLINFNFTPLSTIYQPLSVHILQNKDNSAE